LLRSDKKKFIEQKKKYLTLNSYLILPIEIDLLKGATGVCEPFTLINSE
jgi:hypothetical protein